MFDRCRLWRRKLIRRADGALSTQEWSALEEHLARCKRCQAAFDADSALRATLGAHSGLLAESVARSFDNRVVAALAAENALARMAPGLRSAQECRPVTALVFFAQIVGGTFAATAITALCLASALHPAAGEIGTTRSDRTIELGRSMPPVPLESLLEATTPRAALLWTEARLHPVQAQPSQMDPAVDALIPQSATEQERLAAPHSARKASSGSDSLGS